MKRGRFIVFEGCEGSGKTTVLMFLQEKMKQAGLSFVATREPGGTPLGNGIRGILLDVGNKGMTLLTELFLFCGVRSQHIADVIDPALKKGHHVLCDRFSPSTIAYQGYGRGALAKAKALDRVARGGLWPDAIIYLDIMPEHGIARTRNRQGGDTRFEAEEIAFHHRVRSGFLAMCEEDKKKERKTWFLVDASQPQELVAAEVWGIVRAIVSR